MCNKDWSYKRTKKKDNGLSWWDFDTSHRILVSKWKIEFMYTSLDGRSKFDSHQFYIGFSHITFHSKLGFVFWKFLHDPHRDPLLWHLVQSSRPILWVKSLCRGNVLLNAVTYNSLFFGFILNSCKDSTPLHGLVELQIN